MENQFSDSFVPEPIQTKRTSVRSPKMLEYVTSVSTVVENGYGSCKSCGCRGYKANDPKK